MRVRLRLPSDSRSVPSGNACARFAPGAEQRLAGGVADRPPASTRSVIHMVSPPRASLSSKRTAEGTVVARLRGAVCVGSAAGISTGILDSLGATGTALTVDLGAVTFIDRRGVPGLLRGLRQAGPRGHPVPVVRPKHQVWQTVQGAGLARPFQPSAAPSHTAEPDGVPASDRDAP